MRKNYFLYNGGYLLRGNIAVKALSRVLLTVVLGICVTVIVRAQLTTAASYPFKAKAKTYTYLTGGTSVNLQADDITNSVPIGFTFTYCGTGYTTVSPSSNGFMYLGSTTSAPYTNSQTGTLPPMLMPMWDDLYGVGGTSTYLTTGSPGNRVFTMEWRNWRPLSYTSYAEISFQVLLYEASGGIEFLYKKEGSNPTPSATIGIVGKTNSDYQTLPNSGTNPTPSSSTFTTSITSYPTDGQSYFWGIDCPVKFPAQPQNVSACASEIAIFTAAPDSASQYQWQWYGPTGWTDLGNDAVYSGVNSLNLSIKNTQLSWDKYRYRIVATNVEKNCSVESDEALLMMIPSSNSTVVIAAAPGTEVCNHEEVTITSAFTKGGTSPQYRWILNGLEIPGAVNASLKIDTLDHGDVIQCRFISNQQCVFESISPPIKFDVVSNLLTEVGISSSYNGGSSYTFIADPKNGGDNPRFYWYINNKLLPGETNQSFTTDMLKPWDKVSVAMLSSRECANPRMATSRLATTSVAGVSSQEMAISVSPNPNSGKFAVRVGGLGNSTVVVSIMNSVGAVIYTANAQSVHGVLSHDVDLSGRLAAGVYLLGIDVNGQQKMMKFSVAD